MNRVISQSDVKARRFCKRQGLLHQRTERHESAGPARVGQAFHALMAQYARHLLETGQPSDVTEAETIVVRIAAQLNPVEAKDFQSFALESCLEFPWDQVLAGKDHRIEQRLFVTIEDRPRAIDARAVTAELANHNVFAGTPDLTWEDQNGILHLLDYKTGWNIAHVSDPAENFQLNTYLAAILVSTGDRPANLHVYHARSRFFETAGITDPDEPPKSFGWSDVRVDWEAVRQTAVDIKEDDANNMTFGAHCVQCSHKVGCGAYAAHVFGVMESPTAEDALSELVNLRDRSSTLEKIIKSELENRRVIIAGTHKAEFSEKESGGFKSKAIERLEEMLPRHDFLKTVNLTKTNLKKTFARHKMADAVDGFVEEYRVTRKSTKLDIKQVGARSEEEEEG